MVWDARLIGLIGVDAAIAGVAPVVNSYWNADIPLQVGAALLAVWTFFMMWQIQRDPVNTARETAANPIRDAVAAAFVMTYLVMVGWSTFFRVFTPEAKFELGPISKEFIANFTFLTGIVVGSYFGADAIKQVAIIRNRPSDSGEKPVEPSPGAVPTAKGGLD
jgi:hypothetical protein